MNDPLPPPVLSSATRNVAALYIGSTVIIGIIFGLDLIIPLGVATGVLYVAVVLLSLWAPRSSFTLWIAVITSILTCVAFFYKDSVPDMWKVIANRSLSLFAIWVTAFLGLQRKKEVERHEETLRQREQALHDVRILRGFLPICASCKKIRDDNGYWTQIERYIRAHSEADFSHGLCPECENKLYPEYSRVPETHAPASKAKTHEP